MIPATLIDQQDKIWVNKNKYKKRMPAYAGMSGSISLNSVNNTFRSISWT